MTDRRNGGNAAEMLRGFIEELEENDKQREQLKAAKDEIFARLSGTGFSPKVVRALLKERKKPVSERLEFEALLDVYRGALGMLAGRGLSDDARRRLAAAPQPKPEDEPKPSDAPSSQDEPAAGEQAQQPAEEGFKAPVIGEAEIKAAFDKGVDDAKAGAKVLANPYVAGDPRRAAWDEGWCFGAGSDGMDIPEAYRPKPKGDDDKNAGGGDGKPPAPPAAGAGAAS
jgi:uncharacterized protein (UPF0335 family)